MKLTSNQRQHQHHPKDALFLLQSDAKYADVAKEFSSPKLFLDSKFDTESNELKKKETKKQNHIEEKKEDMKPTSPFMWGSVSAGPLLAPKLNSLFSCGPTDIQSRSFSVLSKSNSENAVIASPTGTGKTLAFLLPLIANAKRDECGRIMIVTPTLELASQIQRVVDQLWGTRNNHSGMYIVKPPETETLYDLFTAEIKLTKAPIIAGTPKSLMQFVSYCKLNNNGLFDHLSTIVLDECDRLLQTDLKARGTDQKEAPAVELLYQLKRMGLSFNARDKNRARLICASATIGRTLRTQIMEITDSTSIDKAANLVTADERTGKNESARRNSLLPATIVHSYTLYEGDTNLIKALGSTMNTLKPGRSIVFPGKMGVIAMAEELQQSLKLHNVNTLRDEVHWDESAEENAATTTSWEDAPIFVVGEKFARGLDIAKIDYVFLAVPPTNAAAYAHLAGRTGRGNESGHAIVLVQGMKEAIRIASVSDALGIPFVSTDAEKTITSAPFNDEQSEIGSEVVDVKSLSDLNVVQLKELLRERNLKVSGLKIELIERLSDNK